MYDALRWLKREHLVIFCLPIFLLSASAVAFDFKFEADLDGDTSVPPTATPASGYALLLLNADMTEVSYYVEYQDLLGEEVAAHFHHGGPGQLGPIFFTLRSGNPKTGIWNVTAFEASELLNGAIYVNVHSTAFPGGEIRGDFDNYVIQVDQVTWGAIKDLYK
jgi:hypothetical protein